jgi:hypothetical protein
MDSEMLIEINDAMFHVLVAGVYILLPAQKKVALFPLSY